MVFRLKSLHLVGNDQGELLNISVTPGNTDDRKPVFNLLKGLSGKVVADRGYVSQKLFEQMLTQIGIQLITQPKRNMKNKLMPLMDKLLTRKRSMIETIIDQLKNISQPIAFQTSQSAQFLGELGLWTDCLLPSA